MDDFCIIRNVECELESVVKYSILGLMFEACCADGANIIKMEVERSTLEGACCTIAAVGTTLERLLELD